MIKSVCSRFPLISYIILAYGISWILWIPVVRSGEEMSIIVNVFHVLGGLGPFLAALIMLHVHSDQDAAKIFKRQLLCIKLPLPWYALVLLLPFVLLFFSYLVLYVIEGTFGETTALPPFWLYPLLFLWMTVLGGGLEEPGWRGFMLPRLLTRYNPLIASLLIGLIWGFWHLPLFLSQSTSQENFSFGLFMISALALSIIFTWVYMYTQRSIFLAILLHGGINTALNWFPMGDHTIQPFVSFTIVAVVVALVLHRRLLKVSAHQNEYVYGEKLDK